jgi:hypothetical protein
MTPAGPEMKMLILMLTLMEEYFLHLVELRLAAYEL